MVDTWNIYQVGMNLGAIRDYLRPTKVHASRYQRLERAMATVAVRTGGQHDKSLSDTSTTTDEYFLARILLGILQRGYAPLASPFVERVLLQGCAENPSLTVHNHEQDVRYSLEVSPQEADEFAQSLGNSLFLTDPRVMADWSKDFDSVSERTFVEQHLSPVLGSGIALLEAQRPVLSMIDEGMVGTNEFIEQRVDFAIECPSGARICFEIDGPQHRLEPQLSLDRTRDQILRSQGWHVERIPVERFTSGTILSAEALKIIETDQLFNTLKGLTAEPFKPQSLEAEAVRFGLSSHSIARIQLAVLLALLDGTLRLDAASWDITVIERDVPCASLAISDVLDQLQNLGTIYDIRVRPTVNLFVLECNDLGFEHLDVLADERVQLRYLTYNQLLDISIDLDLVIDVSVRARPADTFDPSAQYEIVCSQARRSFILRTAYRRAPETFLPWPDPRPVDSDRPSTEELTYFLQLLFRKRMFRPQQSEIICRALERKSVIGLLPTGGGKSVTFQMPTLLSPGVTIVIAPLRSLIDDQEDNLHRTGINRVVAIHGGRATLAKQESLKRIAAGSPRFIYIAPERLQMATFRDDLAGSPIARSVAFVVVDEAHCVSEWGHDFRPAYLNVGRITRALCRTDQDEPPILALTGTASNSVLLDIERELEFDRLDEGSIVSVDSFDRKNLKFIPVSTSSANKPKALFEVMSKVAGVLNVDIVTLLSDNERGGLVFCRYVNGVFGVDGVSRSLRRQLGWDDRTIRIFSGGKPRNIPGDDKSWNAVKLKTQRDFKDNQFPLLVATSSFGMGIDKANIRYTVHYGIPSSLEALAQEAGRAGRSGEDAACAIVFTDQDLEGEQNFLSMDIHAEKARGLVNAVPWSDQGDASRIMFLHFTSYKGIEGDVAVTKSVLGTLRQHWAMDHVGSGETPYSASFNGQDQKIRSSNRNMRCTGSHSSA